MNEVPGYLSQERWEHDFKALGLSISDEQLSVLQSYLSLLQRWNKTYNLTAIRDPEAMVAGHIMDSLAVVPHFSAKSCLDVGSGGGLPGIPLAILFPDTQFTLLDTNGKKTRFMQQAAIELGLKNITLVQARIEAWQPEERFDCIVSRAFSSIKSFVDGASMHLSQDSVDAASTSLSSTQEATNPPNSDDKDKKSGRRNPHMLAMKGKYPAEELEELPAGFCVAAKYELTVPGLDAERHLIEITADTSRPA